MRPKKQPAPEDPREQAEKTAIIARKWLQRSQEKLDNFQVNTEEDINVLNSYIKEFEDRLRSYDEAEQVFESMVDLSQLDDIIEDAATFRDTAMEVKVKASTLLSKKSKGFISDTSSIFTSKQTAKLPKLELPKFSGDVKQWQSFWDQYKAIVDQSDMSPITKFTYLQSLLEGDAKAAIQGLTVTEKHYEIACKLLEDRFGRKERIIFAHVQALLNLQAPASNGKVSAAASLRKLQDTLLGHVRSLEALGIGGETYGVVLTPLLLSRLPTEIRLEWARDGEGKESDLDGLLSFLQKEIERRERSEAFKTPECRPDRMTEVKSEARQRGPPTASALQSSSTANCNFCEKSHPTWRCHGILKLSTAERKNAIKTAGLCFVCLAKGHLARACSRTCLKCKGRHNSIICPKSEAGNQDVNVNVGAPMGGAQGVASEVSTQMRVGTTGISQGKTNQSSVLQTAKVWVQGPTGSTMAHLLFDSGSDKSYVSSSLVKKVGLRWLSSEGISYTAFGGSKSNYQSRNVFEVQARGGLGDGETVFFPATEIPQICCPLSRKEVPANVINEFGNLPFADDVTKNRLVTVDLLIGMDVYWKLVKPGSHMQKHGLVAQDTVFGWILSGSFDMGFKPCNRALSLMTFSDLSVASRNFWELEAIGILDKEKGEDCVLKSFKQSVSFDGARYEVTLPWKENFVLGNLKLVNNYRQARARLASLSRKLRWEPDLEASYNKVLQEMEDNNIIVEVKQEEISNGNPVFYLPHRPVVREDSLTTKVRPVFDASASGYNGVSLNDCIETGPSLIPNLPEILIRFRRWPVAIVGDISKAFLQIKVRPQDQDVHRFLWEVDGKIRVMKFLRVPFGNKSSPFLLNATVKHHVEQFGDSQLSMWECHNTTAVSELQENLYVDDFLSGANSDLEARDLFAEVHRILGLASLPLAKFGSNSKELFELFCNEYDSKVTGTEIVKVLGIRWLSCEDSFSFHGVDVSDLCTVTKRVVLSFIARLFDPLGLIAPFTMTAKILFQEIWTLGLDWDTELPAVLCERFTKWIHGFNDLKTWHISRCYASTEWKNVEDMELIGFGDSSEKAYGACVYLKVPLDNGQFKVSLVTSKARVAPLKKLSLPRLELLGALLCARLIVFVRHALHLPENVACKCWTDSSVTLAWIKGDAKKWKPFVANRVSEIQDLTDPACWRHCPGKDNPADLLTRGLSAADLVSSQLWLEGPEWLTTPTQTSLCEPCESFNELSVDSVIGDERLVMVTTSHQFESVLPVERWGGFTKAIRITAFVLQFIANCRLAAVDRKYGALTYKDLEKAKVVLFQQVQGQAFNQEITTLKKGQTIAKSSKLARLGPFLDTDGLLKVKGRLQMSDLTYAEKHPIILPRGHLALLLIRFQHVILKHASVSVLVSSLRNTYWIISLRRLAKRVKKECIACQKQDSQPATQIDAPLPVNRVQKSPPFTVTGVDYAGPLFCCDKPKGKLYILLFTCAVVRGIHLELVDSLSLENFMLALRRFCSRRGMPSVIYSDNAKTFKGAESELLKLYGTSSPKWTFIAPRSPWWGGWWERLVRSVKSALKRSIGTRCLTRNELETTLVEIEACVNSRPLTFVGDDFDSEMPLTPSHFLLGRPAGFKPTLTDEQIQCIQVDESTIDGLKEREIFRLQQLERFWSLWQAEYLRNLPPVVRSSASVCRLKEGSVVLIKEDNIPRLQWPVGIICKVFTGKDGLVRAVEVKTCKGKYTRPIQRLCNLELIEREQVEEREGEKDKEVNEQTKTRAGRQSRPPDRLVY